LAVVAAFKSLLDFVVAELWTPKRDRDPTRLKMRIVQSLDVQGRTESGAIVASRRLDEDAIKEIAALDEAVRGTVESDATGQAEVLLAGLPAEMSQDMQLAGLQNGL